MTDNDIIKAWECHTGKISHRCMECPYTNYGCYCLDNLHPDTLDLINRQKAEIEEWKKILESRHRVIDSLEDSIIGLPDQIRAEAVKEFAERLKEKQQTFIGHEYTCKFIYLIDIDNLVKEMVGEG